VIFISYSQTSEERAKVTLQHFKISLLDEETLNSGLLVESIPTPEFVEGKEAVLYVNPQTKELWYEYEDAQFDEMTLLKGKNQLLTSAITELTMYVAEQDGRIEQQNQAISELSILIAGGNA